MQNCDFKTNNSALLKKHLQNVHEDKKSKMIKKCTKCEFKAESTESLKKHFDQAHECLDILTNKNSREQAGTELCQAQQRLLPF